jgi:hypothetical protein
VKFITLVSTLCTVLLSTEGWAVSWLDGHESSCQLVCQNRGGAVTPGNYRNGRPFTVCSANVNGEGNRPGYNVEPDWSNKCFVGWGGREEAANLYLCLCNQ